MKNVPQGGRGEAGGPVRKHCSNPGKIRRRWLEPEGVMVVVRSARVMGAFCG